MTSTSGRFSTSAEEFVEQVHRAEWGRLLSLLVSRTRRLDLAEDALAEAFARAAQRWPSEGTPANPAGWLFTTAHRGVLASLRREATVGRVMPLLAVRSEWEPPSGGDEELADDRLHLILLCCHPALPRDARAALALRLVVGTPTEQIARLFLVSTATMAARLTRAKKKIATAGIPLGAPLGDELRGRLDEVCRTIYLAFTAGYTPGVGVDLLRADLAGDAVSLAGVLVELVPDAPQARALRALLVLQHSRRDGRVRDGRLITLGEQDRSTWHVAEIDEGVRLVDAMPPTSGFGEELRLQAMIAAEHARAPAPALTDWVAIAAHYAALETLTGSPIVRLNRAVAVGEAYGASAGLALLPDLDQLLGSNHRLAAVRADLAWRAGDRELARTSFRSAIEWCANEVERSYLVDRLAELDRGSGH